MAKNAETLFDIVNNDDWVSLPIFLSFVKDKMNYKRRSIYEFKKQGMPCRKYSGKLLIPKHEACLWIERKKNGHR